jgi:hypothetical protein
MENSPFGSFGAGQHQWHWLEGKFLNFFPQKTEPAEVLALGGTSGTVRNFQKVSEFLSVHGNLKFWLWAAPDGKAVTSSVSLRTEVLEKKLPINKIFHQIYVLFNSKVIMRQ